MEGNADSSTDSDSLDKTIVAMDSKHDAANASVELLNHPTSTTSTVSSAIYPTCSTIPPPALMDELSMPQETKF